MTPRQVARVDANQGKILNDKLTVIFNTITRFSLEDDLYISYALDTPGCMAQGKTISEAEAELAKAREDYLRDWWAEVGIRL